MAMSSLHSPSLVLSRDIPSRVRGAAKVGVSSASWEADRSEEEATSSGGGGEHWGAPGLKRAVGVALSSVFCCEVAAVSGVSETDGIASFLGVPDVVRDHSALASGLLLMPPIRLVNRPALFLKFKFASWTPNFKTLRVRGLKESAVGVSIAQSQHRTT